MMLRTLDRAAAAAYIQQAITISNMPHTTGVAIDGERVIEMDAPWCKVFHHWTEK